MQLRRISHALTGIAALAAVLVAPLGAHAVPGITPVGTLERFPQEAVDAFGPDIVPDGPTGFFEERVGGTLLPVPGADQLWQLYADLSPRRTEILVRDAGSLRVVHTFAIDRQLVRATLSPTFGGEWLHATDGGRRVFVVGSPNELLEIDTATFAVRSLGWLTVLPTDLLSSFGLGGAEPLRAAGLTYDSVTGDLLVLYGGIPNTSIANRLTVLQRINLTTGARTNRVVRSCTGPLPATEGVASDTIAAELLLRDDAVYVTCQKQLRGFFGSPSLDDDTRALVVKLPRSSLWDSTGPESSVEAGRRFDAAPVDPVGGRIAVLDITGTVTVVDIESMTIVGTYDTTDGSATATGTGLDRTSGRLFFQSNKGFGYLDLRPTPLPAPTLDPSAAADGQERIVPDPRNNQVYVLPGWAVFPNAKPHHYTIYNVAP